MHLINLYPDKFPLYTLLISSLVNFNLLEIKSAFFCSVKLLKYLIKQMVHELHHLTDIIDFDFQQKHFSYEFKKIYSLLKFKILSTFKQWMHKLLR